MSDPNTLQCWMTQIPSGSSSKIAVLTGNLPNYDALGQYTIWLNKSPYCTLHGYHLEVVRSVRKKFQDSRSHASGFSWSRLEHMAEMVESGKWEWVWCVGCDTLITNFNIRLEDIIAPALTPEAEIMALPRCPFYPNSPAPDKVIHWQAPPNHRWCGRKHLLICAEHVTPMQADSFLVRGSQEGSDYLRDILSHYEEYKHHAWVENQTMIDLRDKHAAITYMVPQWKLNSVDYMRWKDLRPTYRKGTDCFGNRGQWRPGDFLIHWPAASLDQRFIWLEQYSKHIIYENCTDLPACSSQGVSRSGPPRVLPPIRETLAGNQVALLGVHRPFGARRLLWSRRPAENQRHVHEPTAVHV